MHWLIGAWMAPFALLGAVGVHMQAEPDRYRPLEYGPQLAARLFAYATPVAQVEALRISPAGKADPVALRRVADGWIGKHALGELTDVPQCAADDDASDGLKAEIVRARSQMTSALRRRAETEAATGHPQQATEDFVRAIRLTRVFRHSDLISMHQGTREEVSLIRRLRELQLPLSAQQATYLQGEDPERARRHVSVLLTRSAAMRVRDDALLERPQALNLGELRRLTRFIERNVPDSDSVAYVRNQSRRAVPEVPGMTLMARVAWQTLHALDIERSRLRGTTRSQSQSL